jgi:hypothetical protein
VREDAWREALEASGMFGEDARFRNAWKRSRDRLGDDHYVSFRDGYVWTNGEAADWEF